MNFGFSFRLEAHFPVLRSLHVNPLLSSGFEFCTPFPSGVLRPGFRAASCYQLRNTLHISRERRLKLLVNVWPSYSSHWRLARRLITVVEQGLCQRKPPSLRLVSLNPFPGLERQLADVISDYKVVARSLKIFFCFLSPLACSPWNIALDKRAHWLSQISPETHTHTLNSTPTR